MVFHSLEEIGWADGPKPQAPVGADAQELESSPAAFPGMLAGS